MHGGFPVICLVGMGLNRMITAFYDDLAHSLGLRIITPDRPGVGGSDPVSDFDRRVSTWPETDLAPLLSHLNINKFILVGNSLGACYALASALHFKFAIHGKIYLLSPWIAESQLPAKDAAPISHRFLRALPSGLLKTAQSLISPYESTGKDADVIVPGDVTASIWAAATTNANAAIDLMTSLERPNKMGFKFEDVNQEVKVWHGSLDSRISPGRVQQVVGRMNRGEVIVVEGAGHGLMGNAKVVSEVLTEIARDVAMR
ncbi:alpha/beta-hydrolase [Saitoella complicata NRRL Y-17804]|uniref:alpha/beta-hydrolase n=1 Tax=Saitoella complicata (strain BCRC 22490 / CBS 7301 / JCM 7358 / NBRC 10748 / NRRL Y-17804) TaxID=698492 RepID=UPI0008680E64|nr:alpha/beta-hydrolase [Saitoella complicata NRRL Y-17804]ODQ49745.1 alpha/beta-hydrolase [Saitoella complicata NRRL Y-17804]